MDKKCICFCRVSTQLQSLKEQKEKVLASAIADGYKRNEIAIVEGKESAIKLKEEERETIEEMKAIIADNPLVESVYVFAIDRLARRASIILSVKEYLTERNINLVFLNPHKMGTLRKDEKSGKMVEDELTALLLMLLSYGAEMEMKIKKARFATARDALKAQGKIASGSVLYGYKRATDGKAIVDENEADNVRFLFETYLNEEISLMGLFKKMVSDGRWEMDVKSAAMGTRVRNILTNPAYSGETPTQRTKGKKGIVRTEKYPAIVDKEIQDAVIAKLQIRKKADKTTSKNIYYGKGIVKYQMEDGREFAMTPIRRNLNYAIINDDIRAGVNLNVIDSILWDEAATLKRDFMKLDTKTTKETYIKTIKENKAKIKILSPKLEVIKKKQQQAFRMLMKGAVSEENYNIIMSEIADEEMTISKAIAKLETENSNMELMIKEIADASIKEGDLAQIDDDEERAKIVRQVIDKVIIRKGDAVDTRTHKYTIEVVPKDVLRPFNHAHTWVYWVSGGVFNLYIEGRAHSQNHIINKRIKRYPR